MLYYTEKLCYFDKNIKKTITQSRKDRQKRHGVTTLRSLRFGVITKFRSDFAALDLQYPDITIIANSIPYIRIITEVI